MDRYIYPKKSIEKYIESFVDKDNSPKELAPLLIHALKGPLKWHDETLTSINAPGPEWHDNLVEQFNLGNKEWLRFAPNDKLDRQVSFIRDWFHEAILTDAQWLKDRDTKGKPKMFQTFEDFDDILQQAGTFHTLSDDQVLKLQENWANIDEERTGDIIPVMTFDDGFRIVEMKTLSALERETAFMGHCIANTDICTDYVDEITDNTSTRRFFSLRDPNNKPHITIDSMASISDETLYLIQCKDKQNLPAHGKYAPYIIDFLEKTNAELSITAALPHIGFIKVDDAYINIFDIPEGTHYNGGFIACDLRKTPTLPESIKGDLDLRNTKIESLHPATVVNGNLIITNTGLRKIDSVCFCAGQIITDIGKFSSLDEAKNAFSAHYGTQERHNNVHDNFHDNFMSGLTND